MDLRQIYADTRERIVALVSDVDGDPSSMTVPACPDWSIKDLVAHLCGILSDILSGNIDGVATDPWTAKQVDARKQASLAEILDEWHSHAATVEPMIGNFPPQAAATLCADIYTHEQDIRGALSTPGNRSGAALDNALELFVSGLQTRLEENALALRVDAGDRSWTIGASPSVSLSAEPFELIRAISGRRSVAQVRAYDWSGDPEPYLGPFPMFTPRSEPLVE